VKEIVDFAGKLLNYFDVAGGFCLNPAENAP